MSGKAHGTIFVNARPLFPFLHAVPVSPPEQLGKYQITGVIGEGAMGVVYRGFDPVIGRTVAIKTLSQRRLLASGAGLDASALSARFRHEAQAVGRLAHPGIVAVHEYGEEAGIGYIVMEHVEGQNLSQWLARTPRLPEFAVVHLMDQLLDALDTAHAAGVWHRDIKPSNVLVTAAGRVKLTDFGIARFAEQDEDAEDTTITGSPGYIAPELYTGDPIDHRADVFSAGVLLFRLLVGRAPFAGTPEQAMYKTLNEDPLPVSAAARDPEAPGAHDVPRGDRFDAVVQRALQKNPHDRFVSAASFRHALRHAAGLEAAMPPAMPAFPAPPAVMPASSADAGQPSGFGTLTGPTSPPTWPSGAACAPTRRTRAASASSTPTGPQALEPLTAPRFRLGDGSPEEKAWRHGVEAALFDVRGSVARALMRRALAVTADPTGLVARLAASMPDDADRTLFLHRVRALTPGIAPLASAASTFGAVGPGACESLPAEAIGHALRVLTAHLGPDARALIKGVAGRARSTEEFHELLIAQAGEGDGVNVRLLARQLQRGPQ